MTNGQKIYACGMGPQSSSEYSFKIRNAAYLAANMAEFIINPMEAGYTDCKDACSECADGIKDPVTGDAVTVANFVYVCLGKGQKIYFASHVNRKAYLDNVNSKPRYLVDDVLCSGVSCPDATTITTLSSGAQSFVSEYPSASGSGTTSSADSTLADTSSSSSDFCTGQGSVMFNGFQSSINGSCVMLLFQSWVLNTTVKYAFGFIGCFIIAILNELLVKMREVVRRKLLKARKLRPTDKFHKIQCKLALALLYMVQMTVAYFAMLVVMTYETGLFIALLTGFGVGFMLFKSVDLDITEDRGAWRFTNPSTIRIEVGGMSCKTNCGTAVETALKNTPGVAHAVVEFDERAAYVSGSAAVEDLVAAIEAAGYTATIKPAAGAGADPRGDGDVLPARGPVPGLPAAVRTELRRSNAAADRLQARGGQRAAGRRGPKPVPGAAAHGSARAEPRGLGEGAPAARGGGGAPEQQGYGTKLAKARAAVLDGVNAQYAHAVKETKAACDKVNLARQQEQTRNAPKLQNYQTRYYELLAKNVAIKRACAAQEQRLQKKLKTEV
ncbi:unnamed protein product [Phytophthora fragariaefolia]|uniref:Unnamed protein product n=1 Tax=Phytophthora fragariaefolia TaxID=1490495 RepID=A0A9W6XG46_9STRA|nr:unnamed protein product [Phytophthora fragariaefolia]